jgi:hypothetical protein
VITKGWTRAARKRDGRSKSYRRWEGARHSALLRVRAALVRLLVVLVGASELTLDVAALLVAAVGTAAGALNVGDKGRLLADERVGGRHDIVDEPVHHVGRQRLADLEWAGVRAAGSAFVPEGAAKAKVTHDDAEDLDVLEVGRERVVWHDPAVEAEQLLDPLLLDVRVGRLELVGEAERDDGQAPTEALGEARESVDEPHEIAP